MSAVQRLGDIGSGHGCFPPRPVVSSSPNVATDGILVARVGDAYPPHGCPHTPPHGAVNASGSSTVNANGKPISRVGDAISCGSSVAAGSTTGFSG